MSTLLADSLSECSPVRRYALKELPHTKGTHPDYPELEYFHIESTDDSRPYGAALAISGYMPRADACLLAAAPDLLAALKEMGDWIAAGLQASDEAWPDARCLQHTEEIAARARAAVDKAEGRS